MTFDALFYQDYIVKESIFINYSKLILNCFELATYFLSACVILSLGYVIRRCCFKKYNQQRRMTYLRENMIHVLTKYCLNGSRSPLNDSQFREHIYTQVILF